MKKLALFVLLLALIALPAAAEEESPPPTLEPPTWRVDETGTVFSVYGGDYLDITLESSETIHLTMESLSNGILMEIEPVSDAANAQITIGGFLPGTTYYMSEDFSSNYVPFIADIDGYHTYQQDLSQSHMVVILPEPGTMYIRDDSTGGDCELRNIGEWDSLSKTCTLTGDVWEPIQIEDDGITLNGTEPNGTRHYVHGGDWFYIGVNLGVNRSGVTIRDITVRNFGTSVMLPTGTSNCTITGVSAIYSGSGIWLWGAHDNTIIGNFSSYHRTSGIRLTNLSNNNMIAENYLYGNNTHWNNPAISIVGFSNTVTDNAVTNSRVCGIAINGGQSNVVTENLVDYTGGVGVSISWANANTFSRNTISNTGNYGVALSGANYNIFYNNNFLSNGEQVETYNYPIGNIFHKEEPIGGNYWDDYDTPAEGCSDTDEDGFCDSPYVNKGGQDDLPWTHQDAWLDSEAPTTTHDAPTGWQNADFTITLTCTDNPGGSGCKETWYQLDGAGWQVGNSVPVTTDGNHQFEFHSVDNNGNQEATQSIQAKLDKTLPVISYAGQDPVANAHGWNNTDVTLTWSCMDTISGVVQGTVSQTITTEGAVLSATGTCTDLAGNSASDVQSGINIDRTPPSLNPVVDPDPVLLGGTATVSPNASDAISGLDTVSCGAIDTSTVGFKSVWCEAADLAGNTYSTSTTYQVIYDFAGFLQPVDNPPTYNKANAGGSVPVKFSLSGYQGLEIIADGYPLSQSIACESGAVINDIEATVSPGNSILSYDPETDQYTYVWKTDKAWSGTCREFVVTFVDGSSYDANFTFK